MSAVEPPEELLSAYLDGEVTADERALVERAPRGVRRMARRCSRRCARRASSCSGLPMRDAPAGFWDAMLASDDPAPEQTAPVVADRVGAPPPRRKRIVGWCAGAAAAAAIVAVRARARASRRSSRRSPRSSTSTPSRSSVTEEPVSQLAPVTNPVRLR